MKLPARILFLSLLDAGINRADNLRYEFVKKNARSIARLYGRHLSRGGNAIHASVDLVAVELVDVKLTRRRDDE